MFELPSAGLSVELLRTVVPQAVLVGDRVLVRAKPTDFAQLRTAVESIRGRRQITVRLLVVDVGASYRDPVNSFLEGMTVGLNVGGDLAKGLTGQIPVTIQAVYDFLSTKTDMHVRTYTDHRLVSGDKARLAAGNVLERAIYVRPTEAADGASNTLDTRYDRLQLGLTVELEAFAADGGWFLRWSVEDADFQADQERRTEANGSVRLSDHSPVKLVSLDRVREIATEKKAKGLAKIPVVGRAFRSRGANGESRVLYVLVEWLPE